MPILRGQPFSSQRALYFEHEGGRSIINGDWKLVARTAAPWELYHIAQDATETHDLAGRDPARVAELSALWRAWANRVGCSIPGQSRLP